MKLDKKLALLMELHTQCERTGEINLSLVNKIIYQIPSFVTEVRNLQKELVSKNQIWTNDGEL